MRGLMRSRKGYVVVLQWLLVGVVAVWGGITEAWRASPLVFWALAVLMALVNIALMRLPLPYFYQPAHWMQLFIVDTLYVGTAIYYVRGFETDLYLAYFLILLTAAISRSMARGVLVAVGVSAVYMFLIWQGSDKHHILDRAFLIRAPFFFVVALFTSYLAHGARMQAEAMENSRTLSEQVLSLQQLAGGIAHEMRNQLTALSNNLQTLERKMKKSGVERVHVQDALEQVKRLTRIVQETTELARPATVHAGWIDINSVVDRAIGEVSAILDSRGAEVRKRYAPHPLVVWGDEVLLGQIFTNILRNAAESFSEGGMVTVSTSVEITRGSERVAVRISDTGSGIPPHQMERLYQPFYTTKAEGTGLGLSLARKYARAHGGELLVKSQPGNGTQVVIALPVTGPASAVREIKA